MPFTSWCLSLDSSESRARIKHFVAGSLFRKCSHSSEVRKWGGKIRKGMRKSQYKCTFSGSLSWTTGADSAGPPEKSTLHPTLPPQCWSIYPLASLLSGGEFHWGTKSLALLGCNWLALEGIWSHSNLPNAAVADIDGGPTGTHGRWHLMSPNCIYLPLTLPLNPDSCIRLGFLIGYLNHNMSRTKFLMLFPTKPVPLLIFKKMTHPIF